MSADIKNVSDEQLEAWFNLFSQLSNITIVGVPFKSLEVINELLLRKERVAKDIKMRADDADFWEKQHNVLRDSISSMNYKLAVAIGRENTGSISGEYIILKVTAMREAIEKIIGPYTPESDINCLDDAVKLLTDVLADVKWGKGSRYE
jgi:hypothetical protein